MGALEDAARERDRAGANASKYPGGHMLDAAVETLKGFYKIEVEWKAFCDQFLLGDGAFAARDFGTPSPHFFVPPAMMGFSESVYTPGNSPMKPIASLYVIIDSSHSVDRRRLLSYVSLIISMIENVSDQQPEIAVFSADTVLRGEPVKLTLENLYEIKEGTFDVIGRGGTNFTAPIVQTLLWAEEQGEQVAGLMYLTDYGAPDPDLTESPEHLDVPPLAFVGIPADYETSEKFRRAVEPYGECVCIEDGMELDFEAAKDKIEPVNEARRAGMRP
jgi:hypothetical protein